MPKVNEFIVLSGPFRRFETSEEAHEAAEKDTAASRTDHAVIAVDICRCESIAPPPSNSDAELLRAENALLRKEFAELKKLIKNNPSAVKARATK